MLAVHCIPDHTHLFVGIKPNIFIPDFIKEIKVESNEFINQKNGSVGNLRGRKDMVFFHIHILILTMIKKRFK